MPGLSRPLARLAATTVLVAAAAAGLSIAPAAPALADGCADAHGVTVVVDHAALGGGVQEVCSGSGGGQTATKLFTAAGFALTYVQRQPGFVCRIDGQPASDPCVNTPPDDAYWGLWWSDGKSGSWSYSTLGAGSLKVPDGGYVAFAWQSGSKSAPGVPATAHATAPTPTAKPSTKPSSKPSTKPSSKPSTKPSSKPSTKPSSKPSSAPSTKPSATPSPAPSAAPTPSPTRSPSSSADVTPTSPTPTRSPSTPSGTTLPTAPSAADPTSVAPASADPADAAADPGGSLPIWVVPVVLGLLVLTGLGVLLQRRRHRPGP